MHLLEGKLPSVYYFAKAESFGTVPFVRVVELFAVYQGTFVMDTYDATDGRRDLAFARLQYLIINTARKALNTFLCR